MNTLSLNIKIDPESQLAHIRAAHIVMWTKDEDEVNGATKFEEIHAIPPHIPEEAFVRDLRLSFQDFNIESITVREVYMNLEL